LIDLKNACLYSSDGKTNTTKVSADGINEIKYPITNNHESLFDFMQPDVTEIRRRGIARIINRTDARNICLCR
jgi:hypothetical protein